MVQAIKKGDRFNGWSFRTILIFQLAFGFFLSMPTTYNSTYHGLAVIIFSIFGVMHLVYSVMKNVRECWSNIVLGIGIIALTTVGFFQLFHAKVDFWFWLIESVGLSAIIWYTPILTIMNTENTKEPVNTMEKDESDTPPESPLEPKDQPL
jgi:hypothetical protein